LLSPWQKGPPHVCKTPQCSVWTFHGISHSPPRLAGPGFAFDEFWIISFWGVGDSCGIHLFPFGG
jgi:hypothetical protein